MYFRFQTYCVHRQLQRTPNAPIFILGDFNHCKLEPSLPGFGKYVNYKTCVSKILDKCYGNIKNAYTAKPKTPLANSDHNTIQLIPTYKTISYTYNHRPKQWLCVDRRQYRNA